jgi:predicted dehydrogenase
MPSKQLGLGIVGCGGIAQYTFNECQGLENIRLVAAYDPDPVNLAKFRSDNPCEEAESYKALLGLSEVDAVVLAAPPYIRPSQALEAIAAGKPVYSEKPLALTVGEARQVIEAAHEKEVPLMVGHVLRYFSGFARMAEHIRRGDYGKPLALEVHRFGGPFPSQYRQPWRLQKSLSGGLVFEVHVHEFDLSRYICGDPRTAFAQATRVGTDPETDYEDLYMGTIEFESGTIGQYHFSQISPRAETSFTVYLEKGVATASFDSAQIQLWDHDPVEIQPIEEPEEPPYRKEIRLFAEAVLEGKPMPISGEEGLWAVAMAEGFEKSVHTGEAVAVGEIAFHGW